MKNKKNIFFLLPVVLIIWGGVIYQFFSFSDTKILERKTLNIDEIKPLSIQENKPFLIETNYRDPFLGKVYETHEAVFHKRHVVAKPQSHEKKKEVVNWPAIIYKGVVSDSKQESKIFMLVIGGQNYFMKKGDISKDVLLKEGDNGSVSLMYQGQQNTISLKG